MAQVNIARMVAPLESETMSSFVARLDEINELADQSEGFIWRFQTEEGSSAYLRPFADDLILFNLSVWETVEALKNYVYRSQHAEMIKQRRSWFEKFDGYFMALWWIKTGEIPTVEQAKERLEHLQKHGETPFAFTFKKIFPPM
jgi:hypothetical protein